MAIKMVTPKEYGKIVEKSSPKSSVLLNCAKAFLFGGAVCAAGQGVFELISQWVSDEETVGALTSVTMIFFGVLLTAIGVYDKLAKFAGAGSLIPITGFANAMSSAAIEFKSEGFVKGVGARLFSIAGPVIVYGTVASVIYGAVLWVLHMFGITFF